MSEKREDEPVEGALDSPPDEDGDHSFEVEVSELAPVRRTSSSLGPVAESLPGLARITASGVLHTAQWGVGASLRTGRRVARAVVDPHAAAQLGHDVNEAAGVVAGLARAVTSGLPLPQAVADVGARVRSEDGAAPGGGATDGARPGAGAVRTARERESDLRAKGAELLDRSRDVWNTDTAHPAYARILDELAPDEARILLLLLEGGPQPSVDVRTGGPVGMVSSQLIAPGLTMIGARAGCRYLDQVPSYLNNLFRLGLVWFSREPLRDPLQYQVVEAQPDVLAAMHTVRFPKVVRRSIHLTPFGEDFCKTCLVDEGVAESEFPEHMAPPEADLGEPPKPG
jgi:hypothetical protein